MLPPGLNRAISDSTSPFGAYPSAAVLRTLEVYLADPRSTDAVYQGLVNRACTQTISVQLVEKVLALLKIYLLKYTPSQEVLQLLEDFSCQARELAGLSDSGHKAIQYVRSCLRKIRNDRPNANRSFRGSNGSLAGNGGSAGSLRGLWGQSRDDLTRLGQDARVPSVKVSVGSSGLGLGLSRSNDRYGTADTLPSPTDPDGIAAAAALPAFLRQSDGKGARGWEDLRLPPQAQGGLPVEPSWAVPGRPWQLPPPPAGATAQRAKLWMQHLPDLAPRITLAAYAATAPAAGLTTNFGSAAGPALASLSLSLSGAVPISLATIHRCVLDVDDQEIGRHLAEVLGEARAEAEQLQPTTSAQQRQQTSKHAGRGGALGGGGGGAGARDNGKGGNKRGRPARLLFHHPPYNRAEQLPMTEADIAVVVEAVCGVRAANALSAVQGPPTPAEDTGRGGAPGQPEGMWQAAFEEDGEFAQMCGSILMKLIVDLWMRAPVGSYMLALRMLRAALRSDQPSTRARAFDVLYNLSIHGAMLRGEAEEQALAAAATEMGNGVPGARGVQMPWQVCASAPVSPFMSGGGGQTPPPAPRPTAAAPPAAVTTTTGPGPASTAVPHHVASHSLGLVGSTMLDTGSNLPAGGSGPGPRGTIKAVDSADALGPRKDGSEGQLGPGQVSTPAASPAVKVPALGGAAAVAACGGGGGRAGEGGPPTGYDRWLRALLFQLLCDLCEEQEYSEEVWRAAMGCVAQLCSHGGFWVAAWVQHMPPAALAGLLRAACNLNWSQELYSHLLQLVLHVLVRAPPHAPNAAAQQHQPQSAAALGTPTAAAAGGRRPDSAFAAPAGAGSAAAAAAEDAAAAAAAAAAADAAELSQRLCAFGGLDELLLHFMRAPTPDSRAALLTVMAYCCSSGCSGGDGAGSGSLSSSGERLSGGRSPRTSSSPSNRVPDGGPAVMLAALQGLHLDSVCLVLRAALQRPWPGMSSRLADVLASACAAQDIAAFNAASPSPSASVSGSADYASHTLPAGVASPIAVRALLRPLLEALEYACADSMATPQSGERCAHMDISVAHILSGAGVGGPSGASLTAGSVEAAWRSFKETCTEQCADSRQLSLNWLHQLLSAACRACQGQLQLLSPLSLKASQEALKPAHPPGGGLAHPSPPLPHWNVALADALLHVVREAPLGCELLMAALSRVAADQKALMSASDCPASPRMGPLGLGLAGPPHATPTAAAVPGVAHGEEPALAACRRVMWLYYVGLQWMLQCGSPETRMPAVVELADTVLAGLLQPDPAAAVAAAAAAAAGGAAGDRPGATGLPPGPRGSNASLLGAGTAAGGMRTAGASSGMLGSQQQASAAAVAGGTGGAVQAEPGGGMLISQQLLAGLLAVDPDALSCTPPELLVALLQQCSQSLKDAGSGLTVAVAAKANGGGAARDDGLSERSGGEGGDGGGGGFRSMRRGFIGRPCSVGVAITAMAPAAGTATGHTSSGGGGGAGGVARASSAPVRISAASSAVGVGTGGGAGGGGGLLDPASLSGAAVGPWQDDWQNRRLALLLMLMARCSLDPEAFAKYSLSHVIKAQLGCEDLRCRYYAGVYLLKHWMLNQHDKYWRTLRHIIGTAQQLNDERLLDNPYLQMRTMLNVDHS